MMMMMMMMMVMMTMMMMMMMMMIMTSCTLVFQVVCKPLYPSHSITFLSPSSATLGNMKERGGKG